MLFSILDDITILKSKMWFYVLIAQHNTLPFLNSTYIFLDDILSWCYTGSFDPYHLNFSFTIFWWILHKLLFQKHITFFVWMLSWLTLKWYYVDYNCRVWIDHVSHFNDGRFFMSWIQNIWIKYVSTLHQCETVKA